MELSHGGTLEQPQTNGLRENYGDRRRNNDTSLGCHCISLCNQSSLFRCWVYLCWFTRIASPALSRFLNAVDPAHLGA